MSSEREEKIRRRAYELWEQEGHPHGRAWDHWVQAAREIEAEEGGHADPEGAEIPPMPKDFPAKEEAKARSTGSTGGARSRTKAAAAGATTGTAKRSRKTS